MKPLTYRDLRAALSELTPEQLDMPATFVGEDYEAFPIMDLSLVSELPDDSLAGVLEDQQPLMLMEVLF
jgi:hypothetical protein